MNEGAKRFHPMRAAKGALAALFAMNLLNYIDRYILAAVLDKVQGDFGIDDTQGGVLATAFFLSYTLFSPFMGYFGDRVPRKYLLAAGVGIWSLATYGSGLAISIHQMLSARCILGIGEASYATLAPAILGDLFHRESRNRALTIFYIAIPLGAALGYALGGVIGGAYGWRMAFFVVGLPGLAVAFAALFLPEPRRGAMEEVDEADLMRHEALPLSWKTYTDLGRNRSYVYNALAMAAFTFALGGLQYWAPKFLVREKGIAIPGHVQALEESDEIQREELLKTARSQVGTWLGAVVGISGLVGAALGGWLADRLRKRFQGAYFLLSGWTMLAATPFILLALIASEEAIIFASLLIGLILAFMNVGPSNAIIVNVTDPKIRAAAFAVNIFLIHILGDIPSPTLMGAVSDLFGGKLFWGIALTLPAMAASGVFFCLGSPHLAADEEAVLRGLRSPAPAEATPPASLE